MSLRNAALLCSRAWGQEVRKVWRKHLIAEAETEDKPLYDIAALLKLFASRPRRKQLYKVWAKSKARPDLEAEVDARHAAKVQHTEPNADPPPRVSTWNLVASEWYELTSKEEKRAAAEKADKIYDAAIEEWEARASAMPTSSEEAIRYARRIRDPSICANV